MSDWKLLKTSCNNMDAMSLLRMLRRTHTCALVHMQYLYTFICLCIYANTCIFRIVLINIYVCIYFLQQFMHYQNTNNTTVCLHNLTMILHTITHYCSLLRTVYVNTIQCIFFTSTCSAQENNDLPFAYEMNASKTLRQINTICGAFRTSKNVNLRLSSGISSLTVIKNYFCSRWTCLNENICVD